MSEFDIINYKNCITNLTSSIQKHFGLKPFYSTNEVADKLLEEKDYQNVIIFVFDGMGNAIIDKNTTESHYLRKNRVSKMLSTYPPTTANCTTAYLSGLNPVATGWLGWTSYIKDLDICLDNFPNCDTLTKEPFLEKDIAYKKLPYEELGNIIEKETNGNVKYYTVFPSFKENGCKSLKEFEHRIAKICNQEGKKYIYAYWTEPDMAMHQSGTCNNLVKKILNQISKCLKSVERKTTNTIGFVSADHGQIDVSPIALYTYYDVMACLKRSFTCDARTPFFFVKDDKNDEFVRLFNQYFSDSYKLFTKQEIIDLKIFGEDKPCEGFEDLLGDYIAIATGDHYFMLSPESHMFKGHHAGLTLDEMSIPLIVIKN